MKEQKEYLQDIAEIKSLMEKSTRFLSLSGISGILIGIYALLGVGVVHFLMGFDSRLNSTEALDGLKGNSDLSAVVILAVVILLLSLSTGYWFSYQKAMSVGQKMWNSTSRTMMWHFMVPLAMGGCMMLLLLSKGMYEWLAPLSLLFYGLGLYSVSKFTFSELRGLGWLEMGLGLVGLCFPSTGLWCWAMGFGVGHIVYGYFIHHKYEK